MPTDRGLIDQQLQALGDASRWWDQRELRDLPAVLDPEEQILAIAQGKIARVRWLRRSWLIVVTQRRVLCIRSSGRTSWRQLEVSANEITRVSLRVGPIHGRVLLTAGVHTYRFLVPRADAYRLQSALSSLATATETPPRFGRPTRVVHRMLDHVLALPAVALGPDPETSRPRKPPEDPAVDERLHALETAIEELRQQVAFLEQLLRQRHIEAAAGKSYESVPADR